jgi:hypothetical protein
MTIKFETYGIREAVAELRKYDREMYEVIIKDLKTKGSRWRARWLMLSRCNRFAVSVIGAQKAEARMGFRHITGQEFEQVSDQRSLLRNLRWVARQGFIVLNRKMVAVLCMTVQVGKLLTSSLRTLTDRIQQNHLKANFVLV